MANFAGAKVLVVDDVADNRDLLARRLRRHHLVVVEADHGRRAIEQMELQSFDLVLLDIMMPEMNGYEVLAYLKSHPNLHRVPVVVISALHDLASIVRCVELGAEDYLFKPISPVLLEARVSACLEKKRLRDQEQTFLLALQDEQARSDRLLHNILPASIVDRLKRGSGRIADSFPRATVLFADIVGFSELSAGMPPEELVTLLSEVFSAFDGLVERHGLEKIKTIGDAYMVVGGVPLPSPDDAAAIAELALDMQEVIAHLPAAGSCALKLRIGVHSGPVVAGVIGTKKFSYDLWGDTVNLASRMESHGVPGRIQVTEATGKRLAARYALEERGPIQVKGQGTVYTYFLNGRIASR